MDLNRIELIGRVGQDPVTKQVGGKSLTTFSIATSYGKGETQKTDWHNVSTWEKTADIAAQILHKGDRVFVAGRLSYNTVGEGETKKTYPQITAYELINLTARPEGAPQAGNGSTTNTNTKATAAAVNEMPF
jgi:single-strand DNA-binding protein